MDNGNNLIELINSIQNTSKIIPCIFPIHPRTKKKLQSAKLYNELLNNKRIKLIDPMGYIDFMCLQKNSKLVVTDSGGVQEESSFFCVPCLTVRDNTERPITIKKGTNTLVGSSYEEIHNYIENMNYNINSDIELWDGRSSERIVSILQELE